MKINYYFIFQLKIVLHIVIVFPDWNEWKKNIQFNFSILSSKITMVKCSVRTLSSMFYTSCRKSLLFEGIDFWILVLSSWKQFNWHFISNQMALLSIAIIINYFWPPLCNISKVPKKFFRLFSQIIDAKSVTTTQNILNKQKRSLNQSPQKIYFFLQNLLKIWIFQYETLDYLLVIFGINFDGNDCHQILSKNKWVWIEDSQWISKRNFWEISKTCWPICWELVDGIIIWKMGKSEINYENSKCWIWLEFDNDNQKYR